MEEMKLNVDESAIKAAFSESMRARYAAGAAIEFHYRRDDLSSFFIWVNSSEDDKTRETAFFRERFQRYPAELGRFLGWALPKDTVVYQDDPPVVYEKLFPVDELFALVGQRNDDVWLEREQESVDWFRELVAQRKRQNAAENPVVEPLRKVSD